MMNTTVLSSTTAESSSCDTPQAFPPPTALILLASEQLWPNLHSIEYWKGSLKHIFIYHTHDERFSVRPAQRLLRFCRIRCPHVEVICADGDGKPESVVTHIETWQEQYPQHRWVINATGGTKLMFLGAASLIGRPNVAVIYRELEGYWYHVTTHNGYLQTLSLDIPLDTTDSIPVADLLDVLWGDEESQVQSQPPQPLDVRGLTQALIHHQGDWRTAFGACGVPLASGDSAGRLFEQYVAAALLALGVPPHNVVCNSTIMSRAGQALQEIDIVVNYRSRVYVLDCKLHSEDSQGSRAVPLMQQIRDLSDTIRRLGGVGAVGVLIRPNWTFSDEERTFAQDRGLHVLDRRTLGSFFDELARIFRITPLPPALHEAQNLWQNPVIQECIFPGNNRTALMARSVVQVGNRSPQALDSIVDLENLMREWSETLGQNWSACHLWNSYYILRYDQRDGQKDIRQLVDWIQRYMRCETSNNPWKSKSGNTGYWQFEAAPGEVNRFFRQYVGRNL
jgi:hypothetical protein